jgi:hypothetical protein
MSSESYARSAAAFAVVDTFSTITPVHLGPGEGERPAALCVSQSREGRMSSDGIGQRAGVYAMYAIAEIAGIAFISGRDTPTIT